MICHSRIAVSAFMLVITAALLPGHRVSAATTANIDEFRTIIRHLTVPAPVTVPVGHLELIEARIKVKPTAGDYAQLGVLKLQKSDTLGAAHEAVRKAVNRAPHLAAHCLDLSAVRLRQAQTRLADLPPGIPDQKVQNEILEILKEARQSALKARLLLDSDNDPNVVLVEELVACSHLLQSVVDVHHMHDQAEKAGVLVAVLMQKLASGAANDFRLIHQYEGAARVGLLEENATADAVGSFQNATLDKGAGSDDFYLLGIVQRVVGKELDAIKSLRIAVLRNSNPESEAAQGLTALLHKHSQP